MGDYDVQFGNRKTTVYFDEIAQSLRNTKLFN